MRRSWWSRSLAAMFAVWFAFLVAEPLPVMHQCPMHDGMLAMQQTGGRTPDMSGMVMAATGIPHAESTSAPRAPSHDLAHHHCTCMGDCAGAAAVGLPGQHADLVLAVETATARDTGLPNHEYVPVWMQYVLPFENGPPLV